MPKRSTDAIQTLLLQVAEGDQLAFAELFDAYRPNVYTIALRVLGDEWLAEEIVQDTFIKVWLKRATLSTVGNFPAWLHTIARNLTFNALKQLQQQRNQLHALAEETLIQSRAVMGEENRMQEILQQAVARLPEKQKLTYIMIKQQEMKREEVATALQVSPETVKWNLEQAIKSIRKYCLIHLNELPPALLVCILVRYF